eukprot:4689494-Prymnesium_polylepis.1
MCRTRSLPRGRSVASSPTRLKARRGAARLRSARLARLAWTFASGTTRRFLRAARTASAVCAPAGTRPSPTSALWPRAKR